MVPRIYTVTTPVTFSRDTHRLSRPRPYRRGIDTAAIVRYLSRHDDRNQLIVDLLVRAARRGRKILLLTGRRDHALRLRSRLQQRRRRDGESFTVDCYLGGMDRDARQRAQEAQIISATYAMAREGLDIPTLDTLLLATPCGRILQAAGRILRAEECKQEPIVVDLLDPGLPFSLYLAHVRQEEYRALGWRAYPDVELPDLSGHFAALGLQPGQRYQAYRGRGQRPPPREPTGE
jgi:superfamily II DNA or RNA helicase